MGTNSTSKEESPQATAFTEAITAHLGGRAPTAPATDGKVGFFGFSCNTLLHMIVIANLAIVWV